MVLDNKHLPVVFRHAWVLFILFQCVQGAIWWRRAQPRIAQNPELREGYCRLIRSWLIYGNLPWLVMGAGILSGAVPSTMHYFNPRNGPFVIAFYVTVVALWIATFNWMFFHGGAEALVKYPGLLNLPKRPWAVKAVKVYFLLCLAGGVVGLSVMIIANIQVP
jgi:hypothetical protein